MAAKAPSKKGPDIQEMIAKMTKRERIIAYVTFFFILLLLLDKLILGPIVKRINALEEEIGRQVSLIRDGLMITGYKTTIDKEFSAYRNYYIDARKTQEEETADFLKDMEGIAADIGIRLTTINPSGNIENTKFYTKYEVKLDYVGNMEQIIKFIYAVGASKRPTRVESIELLPQGKDAVNIKCSMLISRMLVTI